jgi:hypothetical protein
MLLVRRRRESIEIGPFIIRCDCLPIYYPLQLIAHLLSVATVCLVAEFDVELLGDALGDRHRRDAPRLRAADEAVRAVPLTAPVQAC